jgi:anti-sigma regulatory factor (Ser/Thr protein kinase)
VRTAVELTLGREPRAVPKARRFVRSSLTGEPPAAIHDVEMVVTELVTNAALHGEPPVSVRLILMESTIRVEVEDAGPGLPVVGRPNRDTMTGRGLALVAGVASAWGVEPGRSRGKVVWADLAGDGAAHQEAMASGTVAPEALVNSVRTWPGEPTYTVRLGPIPTDLLLAAKAHVDNVVRELTLVRGGGVVGGALAPVAASLVSTVTEGFAEARDQLKRLALAAAERGDPETEVELRLPASYAEAGERYLVALDQVDRHARAAKLLTIAPPLSHRILRRWYVQAIGEQLRALSSGRRPHPPKPLSAVFAARLDDLEAAGQTGD